VVPDDRDVEDIFGPDTYRSHFYAAQDNLELVVPGVGDEESLHVTHRNMREFFLGFDRQKGIYTPKHVLTYCFRSLSEVEATSNAPLSDASAGKLVADILQSKSDASNNSNEDVIQETYSVIDKILIEMHVALSEALAATRNNYVAQTTPLPGSTHSVTPPDSITVSDLLLHMKHAVTREDALLVESLMWLVWNAHTSPEVNKAIRLGVSQNKRGNKLAAMDAFNLAASLDASFAEAHNKVAALHIQMDEADLCLQRSTLALSLFPEHFGALSGMGMALQKQGM
jgi:hypothetical protein